MNESRRYKVLAIFMVYSCLLQQLQRVYTFKLPSDESEICPCIGRDVCPRKFGHSTEDVKYLGNIMVCAKEHDVRCCGVSTSIVYGPVRTVTTITKPTTPKVPILLANIIYQDIIQRFNPDASFDQKLTTDTNNTATKSNNFITNDEFTTNNEAEKKNVYLVYPNVMSGLPQTTPDNLPESRQVKLFDYKSGMDLHVIYPNSDDDFNNTTTTDKLMSITTTTTTEAPVSQLTATEATSPITKDSISTITMLTEPPTATTVTPATTTDSISTISMLTELSTSTKTMEATATTTKTTTTEVSTTTEATNSTIQITTKASEKPKRRVLRKRILRRKLNNTMSIKKPSSIRQELRQHQIQQAAKNHQRNNIFLQNHSSFNNRPFNPTVVHEAPEQQKVVLANIKANRRKLFDRIIGNTTHLPITKTSDNTTPSSTTTSSSIHQYPVPSEIFQYYKPNFTLLTTTDDNHKHMMEQIHSILHETILNDTNTKLVGTEKGVYISSTVNNRIKNIENNLTNKLAETAVDLIRQSKKNKHNNNNGTVSSISNNSYRGNIRYNPNSQTAYVTESLLLKTKIMSTTTEAPLTINKTIYRRNRIKHTKAIQMPTNIENVSLKSEFIPVNRMYFRQISKRPKILLTPIPIESPSPPIKHTPIHFERRFKKPFGQFKRTENITRTITPTDNSLNKTNARKFYTRRSASERNKYVITPSPTKLTTERPNLLTTFDDSTNSPNTNSYFKIIPSTISTASESYVTSSPMISSSDKDTIFKPSQLWSLHATQISEMNNDSSIISSDSKLINFDNKIISEINKSTVEAPNHRYHDSSKDTFPQTPIKYLNGFAPMTVFTQMPLDVDSNTMLDELIKDDLVSKSKK